MQVFSFLCREETDGQVSLIRLHGDVHERAFVLCAKAELEHRAHLEARLDEVQVLLLHRAPEHGPATPISTVRICASLYEDLAKGRVPEVEGRVRHVQVAVVQDATVCTGDDAALDGVEVLLLDRLPKGEVGSADVLAQATASLDEQRLERREVAARVRRRVPLRSLAPVPHRGGGAGSTPRPGLYGACAATSLVAGHHAVAIKLLRLFSRRNKHLLNGLPYPSVDVRGD
mmetsp:Transcript_39410/g.101993  ORF Transcript_39410/g.101993 Transcript_39410/m.101993 type:complete len:230 (-) Transcript_39410:272-961(-)